MIRVLIADDHPVIRQGVKQILSETDDISVVAEATDIPETLNSLQTGTYDVLVLDLCMPSGSGFEILKEIGHSLPALPVLVMSVHPEEQYALRAVKAGAAGYLAKDSVPEQIVAAIRKVASGGKYVSLRLAETLIDSLVETDERPLHASLSEREFEVMRMIVEGKSVTEIATDLSLSVKTVSTYHTRGLRKMGMHSNAEITRYAVRNRLVD